MRPRTAITTKQRTFYIDDEKVVIKSRNRGYHGNHAGFHIFINGEKFFKNCLTRQEAEDRAYADWVKKHK